jgi:ubiquinone/menaquinone biosynthesis C-methylase UbiE
MIDVKHDNKSLAERYDHVSDYQYNNGLDLINNLGIETGHHVLDLGCGTGRLALHVAETASSVTGIDPSPHRIEVALKNLTKAQIPNVVFELGGSSDVRHYGKEAFDIVFLNAVFHWINNKEEALDNIYYVLKPGGRLGICTGDKDHPFKAKVLTIEALQRAGITNAGAESNIPVNAKELELLLKKSGFRVREIWQKRDPRYFESPEKCLEYVEASSFGNFFSNVPEPTLRLMKAEVIKELEKNRKTQGIESVYCMLFAIAEKD